MSDSVFDWGQAGEPKSKEEIEAEKQAERRKSIVEAQRAEAEKKAKAQDDVDTAHAEFVASVNADQTATHIWVGPVNGNIRNETKVITGRTLPQTHYLRLALIPETIRTQKAEDRGVSKSNFPLDENAKNICAIRLTKREATKAKLSWGGKQEVIEDSDGSKWLELHNLLGRLKLKTTDHNDSEAMTFWFKLVKRLV